MDPIDFIDSKDVRAYLKEIGFKPDSVESAFLIWQSSKKTVLEKHDAWNWIIVNMPDMPVPERNGTAGWDSLHEMLRGYMSIEDRIIEKLKEASADYVYRAEVKEICRLGLTHTFESSYMAALKEVGIVTESEKSRLHEERFSVEKIPVTADGIESTPGINVTFDFQGRLMCIDRGLYDGEGNPLAWLDGLDMDMFDFSFSEMWFDFPVPFERGDIVRSTVDGRVFVLEGTTPWLYAKRDAERRAEGEMRPLSKDADATDMEAWGTSVMSLLFHMKNDWSVRAEEDYLKIERVTDELVGEDRILYAYSALLKDSLEISELLRYVHAVSQTRGHEYAERSINRIDERLGLSK